MGRKEQLKRELRNIYRSLDFVSENFLSRKKIRKRDHQIFFTIYQQLGLAWEYLGLQCMHWDGYRKTRDGKEACRICGKIRGVDDTGYLLPKVGPKRIGLRQTPNSRKVFENKKAAMIVDDTIEFHGAVVHVEVHNGYKSQLFGKKHEIAIAADRTVLLKERGVECHIDHHLIDIKLDGAKKRRRREIYGGFPWEIRKKRLKNFPVIFDFDRNYRFLGLTILQ